MRYLGGKEKIAGRIARILEALRDPGQLYIEPFVGGASVVSRMTGPRRAGDNHPELIALYRAIQSGWTPPAVVTEEQYRAARLGAYDHEPHLKAFIGFGCSFGGKYFGGFAQDKRGDDYPAQAARGLARKLKPRNYADEAAQGLSKKAGGDIDFYVGSYTDLTPKDALLYCDPPYANTTGYRTGKFESAAFWATVRKWSRDNVVVVSEYKAPDDFVAVYTFLKRTGIRIADGSQPVRADSLYMHRPAFNKLSKAKRARLAEVIADIDKQTLKI